MMGEMLVLHPGYMHEEEWAGYYHQQMQQQAQMQECAKQWEQVGFIN